MRQSGLPSLSASTKNLKYVDSCLVAESLLLLNLQDSLIFFDVHQGTVDVRPQRCVTIATRLNVGQCGGFKFGAH